MAGLGLKLGRSLLTHGGIGAALGAGGSLFENAIGAGEDENDRFDFADTLKDTAFGAATGGLFGTLGRGVQGFRAAKDLKEISRARRGIGASLKGIGGLGALIGPDWEPSEAPAGPETPMLGGMYQPGGSEGSGGGLGFAESFMNKYGIGNIGQPPNAPTMTLADYMENARLSRIADSAINTQLTPLNVQLAQIKREREADLQSNQVLGDDIATQMEKIARDSTRQTQAIQNNNDRINEDVQNEVDQEIADSGALLAGGDHGQTTLAGQNAELNTELAAARMADSELLARLGVSGQEILAELASAEQMQTGQNDIKIRTDANDSIAKTRGEMTAVRQQRPGILFDLANGSFDQSINKYQAGLEGYKAKLDAAKARSDQAQGAYGLEIEAGKAAAGGDSGMMDEAQMWKPSGQKLLDPSTGESVDLPIWFTWPDEVAMERGIDPRIIAEYNAFALKAQEAQ